MVALLGQRNGYVMLAASIKNESYETLPDKALMAAKAWATRLEQLGSPRAYWMVLSEQVRQLHIHIFPRWAEDTLKGVALFETRDSATESQPAWTPMVQEALHGWAEQYQVEVIAS